jgi:metal-responsive CopG/Arc/MetJ family transcriptional regulator
MVTMASSKQRTRSRRAAPEITRASVSFPANVYEKLERIAEAKKVSLAWVVREAAERYVAEHPTTGARGRERS